jgi:hypothetical protein
MVPNTRSQWAACTKPTPVWAQIYHQGISAIQAHFYLSKTHLLTMKFRLRIHDVRPKQTPLTFYHFLVGE